MRELTSIFDYFVLATGSSRRQLHAISEEIDHTLEETLSDHRLGIEGYVEGRWILLDYGDVVIHLFDDDGTFRPYVYGLKGTRDMKTFKLTYLPDPARKLPVTLFAHGYGYYFLGLIPTDIHLIGVTGGEHLRVDHGVE